MEGNSIKLTISQFAKLHNVNRRTLHYYDTIGLFSPNTKGDNNYRYYDISQSAEFEYICILKALNMSIKEIKDHLSNPESSDSLKLIDKKINDIDQQIYQLSKTKASLQTKKRQLELCGNLDAQDICIVECEAERYWIIPFPFQTNNLGELFLKMKKVWSIEMCRMGIGSYVDVRKILNTKTAEIQYEGVYTPALDIQNIDIMIKPKGTYLRGFQIGQDTKLDTYKRMFEYADKHQLKLCGYAFERVLNDFAISSPKDYVVQIMIKIE